MLGDRNRTSHRHLDNKTGQPTSRCSGNGCTDFVAGLGGGRCVACGWFIEGDFYDDETAM